MVLQTLLDVYNYLPVTQTPLIQVQFHRVDNFPPIQQILCRICQFSDELFSSEQISQSYMLLNQFISKQQQTLGPKRFKKLVQSVFTIIVQYLLNVLRQQSQQSSSVYFHLTYYRKNCLKYVDTFSSCFMIVLGLITGYNLRQWGGIEEKIRQAKLALKQLGKIEEHYNTSVILNRLCSLIDAITTYHLENMKKAKDLCSKIINTSSIESISAIKCHKQPSSIVKLQLTLCSYTVMRIYQQMGNYELSMFMMNKFFQYVQKFYQGGEKFLDTIGKGEVMKEKEVRVKLTRLQEKIRRIDLTQQEESNKYLSVNKINKTHKIFSRVSSLHTLQHHNFTSINTVSNLLQSKQNFSLHKQSHTITPQIQSAQSSQKVIPLLRQSTITLGGIITKKQATATNKLKLTKRGINPNIPTSNGFRSNLGRSSSMSFFGGINSKMILSEQVEQMIVTKKQPVIRIKTAKQQKQLKIAQQEQSQLQHLLILKSNSKNTYRLKQETLKYLSKQSNQLKRMIRIKNNEINQLQKIKVNLIEELDLDELKGNIQQSKMKELQLMRQINSNKWSNLSTLPQVKRIGVYLKALLAVKEYSHHKNVYMLVYGDVLNVSQLRMLTLLKQKVQKHSRQIISQVLYKNIKHQVQYIRKQLPSHKFTHIINIYQTQKGQQGINLQQQLSQKQFKIVQYEPFYFNFSFQQQQGKLIPFEKQLLGLSMKSVYYVNKFMRKMKMNRLKHGKKKITYRRLQVGFNYQYGTEIIQKKRSESESVMEKVSLPSSFVFVGIYLLTIREIATYQNQHEQPEISLQLLNKKSFKISHQNIPSSQSLKPSISTQKIQSTFLAKKISIPPQKNLQVTLQTVSDHHFKNKNFNIRVFNKFSTNQNELNNDLQLVKNTLTQQMNRIFVNYLPQIIKIQYFLKKIIAKKEAQQRKKYINVETYHHKSVIYTLIVNRFTKKTNFFIESILKLQKPKNSKSLKKSKESFTSNTSQNSQLSYIHKVPLFIRHDVFFESLQYLSRFQSRLEQSPNFQQMYNRIQKFMKIRMIAGRIFSRRKDIKMFTEFQMQFKKRLCFATIKEEFLFRGKVRQGRIMYMLTVKEFSKIPRPYSLRIFTIDSNAMILIDGQKIIYNKEKLFLQSKLQIINEVIDIFGRNEFEIYTKIKGDSITKKPAPRISILSGYSFHSIQQLADDKGGSANGINKRLSKNSMFAKFRHKALIKSQDLEAIKKFVQQRNLNESQNSQSSFSSQSSIVKPVISQSLSEKHSDKQNS